jgi:hypothetical protein
MQCWQDIAQFQQFLICMLSQAGPFPMQGVTDGSDAKPGMIGEFVSLTGSMSYAANPAVTQQIVSVGVLSPGDWQITSWLGATTPVGLAEFSLSPTPAGVSNSMLGISWQVVSGVATSQDLTINSTQARGSFTVPTLLPFSITINQSTATGLLAGTAILTVQARRVR